MKKAESTAKQKIAAALGVSAGRVTQLQSAGMPTTSVEAAKLWRTRHAGAGRKGKPGSVAAVARAQLKSNPPPEPPPADLIAEAAEPEAALARLRAAERRAYSLVDGAIARAEASQKDEDYSLLPGLMRTHGQATQNRLEAERRWERHLKELGEVAPVSHLIEVLKGLLEPLAAQLSNFPRTIAAQANPQNPAQAEKAIEAGLRSLRNQVVAAHTRPVPPAPC